MNVDRGYEVTLSGTALIALPERAIWWPKERLLAVSDLHLGKSERMARRSGALVPPYETQETLARLAALIMAWEPAHVICLGDSFDDAAAVQALSEEVVLSLTSLMAGRRWTWILGNHDPGPVELGGACAAHMDLGVIRFRHIAHPGATGPEVSGHFHPKARVRGARRPAFVTDGTRLILPAFGTYTGGLDVTDPSISNLMSSDAYAILAGSTMVPLPLRTCAPAAHARRARFARGLG